MTTATEKSLLKGLLPLVAIVFIGFLCIGIPLSALPLHVHGVLGFSVSTVGWVVGIQSFATILTRKFAGTYTDRHGPKRTVLIGLPLASLASVLYLLSTLISNTSASLAVLFVGRLLMGPAESLFLTGAMAWAIGRVGATKTGRVMAWQGIAMFAAVGLGSIVGVTVQPAFGFVGVAIITFLLPFISLAIALSLEPLTTADRKKEHDSMSMMAVLRVIWRFGLALSLSSMPFTIVTSFLVLFYASYHWVGAGTAILGFCIGYIVVRLMFGHLPDRVDSIKLGAVSVVIELIGQLLVWQAHSPILAGIGAVLTGIGVSLIFPAMGVQAIAAIPVHSRGIAVASLLAFYDVALGLTGPVVGAFIDLWGYRSAFLAGALACLLSLLLMVMKSGKSPGGASTATEAK
jgi:MFS family permease